MNNIIYNYAISFAKLLLVLLISFTNATSQDYFYSDKLFGKEFTFTPKDTEICIKFSKNADKANIQNILTQLNLSQKNEGVEIINYGVFKIPESGPYEEIKRQLLLNNLIVGIVPVFVDQE